MARLLVVGSCRLGTFDNCVPGTAATTMADRVEMSVDLKGKRVSGPPAVFKEQTDLR
jgi:hypothetical protein